jgi:hypothetical protein
MVVNSMPIQPSKAGIERAMIVAAELEFVDPSTKLREQLENRLQIITPAKFAAAGTSWEAIQWRLVVVPVCKTCDTPLRWIARVRWLMDDARHELLTPAAEFDLMRSMTSPMARGRILSGPLVPTESDATDLRLI